MDKDGTGLRRAARFAGWLLTLPGALVLLAIALYGTRLSELLGCRTAGIMTIHCPAPLIGGFVEFEWIVALVAASFIPLAVLAVAYALGFVAWRLVVRRRAR